MRPARCRVLLLAVLGAAATLPDARADWLVLVGGKRIETEGPWILKGDLLTVHETSGRILAVATGTVDALACLKLNHGVLHIETIPLPMPVGSPVTRPPTRPGSGAASAMPAPVPPAAATAAPARPAGAAAAAAGVAGQPAAVAGGGRARPSPAAAAGKPAAGAAPAASSPAPAANGQPPPAADAATAQAARERAAKTARQAQLRRELLYKKVVDGCTRMFIVDQAGFRRCVDSQTQGPPPSTTP